MLIQGPAKFPDLGKKNKDTKKKKGQGGVGSLYLSSTSANGEKEIRIKKEATSPRKLRDPMENASWPLPLFMNKPRASLSPLWT